MKDNFEEYVGVRQGPTTRRTWGEEHSFYVDFSRATPQWFVDPRAIVSDQYKTVGEAHRAFLHKLLDAHINDFLSGKETREIPT